MARRKGSKGYKKRFGWICMVCGKPGNHEHHIIPLSKGGRDIPENKILLCEDCHYRKGFHENFQEMKLELLTAKFYAEGALTWIDRPEGPGDACTRQQEALNELSVVPKRDPKPQKKSKVLPAKMPVCLPRSAEDEEFYKRCSWIAEKIRTLRPCACGWQEVLANFCWIMISLFGPKGGK